MGFAAAIGIVLSASAMSMFFVPAVTAMIGHTAWRPGHDYRRRASESGSPAGVGGRGPGGAGGGGHSRPGARARRCPDPLA
ncbi:hypothetical protein [Micromonospora chalcea]|uniref:hypothetical protein n=1 Tax=Micromonospora chalcea TaxID=1874 RepID=UPI00157E042D